MEKMVQEAVQVQHGMQTLLCRAYEVQHPELKPSVPNALLLKRQYSLVSCFKFRIIYLTT